VPLTYSNAERVQLATRNYHIWRQVFVEKADGTFNEMTNLSAQDWLLRAEWTDDIDMPTMEGTVNFVRENGALSLAPYVEASALNQLGGVYSPALSGARKILIKTYHGAPGYTPINSDYIPVFEGVIDSPEAGGRDENELKSVMRDTGHFLMAQWTQSDVVYAGGPMATVLQNILTNNPNSKLGGVVPLYVPVAPSDSLGNPVILTGFTLGVKPVLLALREIAEQIGWTVKYRWWTIGGVRQFLLTLYEPDRQKTVEDYTLDVDEYEDIPSFSAPTDDVRNVIEIGYIDSSTTLPATYRTTDPASIAEFGERFIRIQEEATSNIDTLPEATSMGDAVKLDLRLPYASAQIRIPTLFWIIQTNDMIKLPGQGVIFDQLKRLAVTRFTITLEEDGDATVDAWLRAQVAGGIKTWINKEGQGNPSAPQLSVVDVTQVAATDFDIDLSVATFAGENATVRISTGASGAGTIWTLVMSGADVTPRAVSNATVLGPADWWHDGTTFKQLLNDFTAQQIASTFLYAQATGTTSLLLSPWLTIEVPGYETGWGGGTPGTGAGGATPSGTSVNVIIPVLVATPSVQPYALAADGELFVPFRYNPAPFTKVRLDAALSTIAGAAGKLELRYLDASSVWVPMATPCELDLTVGGALKAGASVAQAIVAETWFAVFAAGGAAASLRGVWVTFEPRALSTPPAPWVPPVLPSVCNSSLSGLQDYGDDWCSYTDDAAARTAYRWAQYPSGFGPWWSDYNEPDEDVEGKDVGLYDNIHVPLAPDYDSCTIQRGLPFNGGSTAIDFDSDEITARLGRSIVQAQVDNYRGMRNAVPVNVLNGSMPQAKVTMVARVWIDGASDLSTNGNFVEPCYVGWSSSGAFGECFVCIERFSPFTGADLGSVRILLVVYSYNNANAYVYDCGSAAPLIGDSIGHEYKLEAQILPGTSSAFDKMQAILTINPLPGSSSTFAGTWIARNQNLLNGGGFWVEDMMWMDSRRNGAGRVHARCYSFEYWFGDKIWLGGTPPLIGTGDVTPAPNDATVVAGPSDSFNPVTRRNGVVVPLDSVYTRYNDGGKILGANKDGNGNAVLNLDDDGSGVPRGVELVLPNVDGAWDLDVTSALSAEANSGAHLWLRESGTGKWAAFGLQNNGTNRRWSLWNNSGELYRSGTDLAYTAFHIAMERFSGSWYFYTYTPGFNTETSRTVASLFTVRADRIGFGGWSGATGHDLAFNYLTKTS
jgi:hypothetical protein